MIYLYCVYLFYQNDISIKYLEPLWPLFLGFNPTSKRKRFPMKTVMSRFQVQPMNSGCPSWTNQHDRIQVTGRVIRLGFAIWTHLSNYIDWNGLFHDLIATCVFNRNWKKVNCFQIQNYCMTDERTSSFILFPFLGTARKTIENLSMFNGSNAIVGFPGLNV